MTPLRSLSCCTTVLGSANNSNSEMKAVMAPGALDGLTKELIYLAVSVANQCDYCINSHGYMARQKGMTEEMFDEFMAVVLAAQKGNKIATGYRVPIDEAFEEK